MIMKKFKKGIAMVELIFALVIMGIALMSAPMLIHQSIQSSNVALQQEAIASLATHLGIVLSKPWDAEDANLSAGDAPIITLNNEVASSPFNFGGIPTTLSVRTSSQSGTMLIASALGQDGNTSDFNDIDDYNNHVTRLAVFNNEDTTAGSLGNYVDLNITINTTVTFADDRPLAASLNGDGNLSGPIIDVDNNIFTNVNMTPFQSHIKFVNALLTGNQDVAELNKTITLQAFSCNLGTYKIVGEQY